MALFEKFPASHGRIILRPGLTIVYYNGAPPGRPLSACHHHPSIRFSLLNNIDILSVERGAFITY